MPGWDVLGRLADPAAARKALADAGYQGERVVLMAPSDKVMLRPLADVCNDLLQSIGMSVDYQVSDWGTILQRRASKAPPAQGGWNMFNTAWAGLDMINPAVSQVLRTNGADGFFRLAGYARHHRAARGLAGHRRHGGAATDLRQAATSRDAGSAVPAERCVFLQDGVSRRPARRGGRHVRVLGSATGVMRKLLLGALLLSIGWPAWGADKVTVAGNKLVAVAPMFIAKDKGYFSDLGIDATLVNLTSAQAIGAAVASGDVQFGMTAFTAGIYTMAAKNALRFVAGGIEETPGYNSDAVLASMAAYHKGVTKLADVAGQRVGLTSVGSPNQYQAFQLARKLGFDYHSMKLVSLQTYGNLLSALRGNQVDVALLSTTMAVAAETSGSAKILGWMGDLEGMQLGAIMVPTKLVREQPQLIVRFLRAYLQALQYYAAAIEGVSPSGQRVKGADYDEALAIIAAHTPIRTPAQVAEGLPYFNPKASLNLGLLSDQINFYKSEGQTDAAADAAKMVDTSFLAEAGGG